MEVNHAAAAVLLKRTAPHKRGELKTIKTGETQPFTPVWLSFITTIYSEWQGIMGLWFLITKAINGAKQLAVFLT